MLHSNKSLYYWKLLKMSSYKTKNVVVQIYFQTIYVAYFKETNKLFKNLLKLTNFYKKRKKFYC